MSTTTHDPAGLDLGYLLALGFQSYVEELHGGLAAAGFSDLRPNFGLVFRALDEGPLTLTQLAGRLGVSKQAAAKVAAELQERRFVAQQAGEDDRRTKLLVLSTRGRDLVRAAKGISHKVERRLRRALGPAAVDEMRRVLVAMVEAGELARGDASRARPVW